MSKNVNIYINYKKWSLINQFMSKNIVTYIKIYGQPWN